MPLELSMLAARYGDCLWIESRHRGRVRRIVIDGGTPQAAPRLRARIGALPVGARHIDLFVVTHVDADHIGGALDVLHRPPPGLTLGDVWFNDRRHLPLARGPAQGARLAALLDDEPGRHPWNVAFGGEAIVTGGTGTFREVDLGWARFTLLSPTPEKLARLAPKWDAAVRAAHRGLPSPEEPQPVPRARLRTLPELASAPTRVDRAEANGSSIAMLLEVGRSSVLLGADAHPDVLVPAVQALARARGATRLRVGAVKLPHHGSQANVTVELVESLRSTRWLVSTNGERFEHPDAPAIARVILHGGRRPVLCFNYRTARTRRWDDGALRAEHGYDVVYPAAPGGGLTLTI